MATSRPPPPRSRHCLNICVVQESGMQTTSLSCLGTSATSEGEQARGMLSMAHLLARLSRKTCVCKRICQLRKKLLTFILQVFFCPWVFFLNLELSSLWRNIVFFFQRWWLWLWFGRDQKGQSICLVIKNCFLSWWWWLKQSNNLLQSSNHEPFLPMSGS